MSIKEQLAELLESNDADYISGTAIAKRLDITRAAVWKGIKQLEADGYLIEAVTNKGYRLSDENDKISTYSVKKYLYDYADKFTMDVYEEIGSTNNVLKENAASLPNWHAAISNSQSAGKGRIGRSFFSPKGTGAYVSVLIRHDLPLTDAEHITTVAAIAACRAIDEFTDSKASIKWINDVFVEGKKTCGILTEASINIESYTMDWVVVGIGFNIYEPEGGFPEELKNIAGAISKKRIKDLRSKISAGFLRHFYDLFNMLPDTGYIEEYKKRSFVIGLPVNVIKFGSSTPAVAVDIDKDCHLIVRYEDGQMETLNSGEVSIRPIRKEN